MRKLRTRVATAPLLLTAALAMAACDSDDVDGADSPGAADTGASATAGATTSAPATTSPSEPTSPEASEPASDDESSTLTGAACLPGNWFVDNQEFGELMSTISGSAVDNVKGSVMVTFRDDGTTTTHYDEWTHTITVDSATVTIVKNGEDSGTYQVAGDGTMTLTDTDLGSTTTSKMEMGGRTVDQSVPTQPSVFSQATFTCEGDALTVAAQGATTVLHREH